MCPPNVPRPRAPVIDNTATEQGFAKRRRSRRGFLATLLTSPDGLAGQPDVARPEALGT